MFPLYGAGSSALATGPAPMGLPAYAMQCADPDCRCLLMIGAVRRSDPLLLVLLLAATAAAACGSGLRDVPITGDGAVGGADAFVPGGDGVAQSSGEVPGAVPPAVIVGPPPFRLLDGLGDPRGTAPAASERAATPARQQPTRASDSVGAAESGGPSPSQQPVDASPDRCADASTCASLAARAVAAMLGIGTAETAVVSGGAVVWPDSGLGCRVRGHAYAAAEEDGYEFVVAHIGTAYHVHLNRDGTQVAVVVVNADSLREMLVGAPWGAPAPVICLDD